MESIFMNLIVFIIFCVVIYVIDTYIPMVPPIKLIWRITIAIIAIWYLLSLFGVVHAPFPHLH